MSPRPLSQLTHSTAVLLANATLLSVREYLAIFKKTVAMHEVFLCRIAAHPVLRKDLNFHVFLEYNQDVSHIICVQLHAAIQLLEHLV